LPDAIIYPTGGGTGLIGMWKAFDEMEKLGWISQKRPRMFSVQAEGCAPIVRAFEAGENSAAEFPNAHTLAAGLRVPKAIGDFLILNILRQSNGGAIAVNDEDVLPTPSVLWPAHCSSLIRACIARLEFNHSPGAMPRLF